MGRIIDYPEISNFTDEDYLVVDGSEGGTRKILGQAVKGVVDSTPTEDSQNAVSSGGVWNSLNDISEEFQSLRSDAYDVYPKKKLTADVVQFDDGAENVPVSEMTAYIYPSMSGSGMPSRTNVRTISGSNSVNVYHANKNLIAPVTYQDAPETVYLGVENSENLLIFFKAGDYRISVKMRDNSAIVPYWVISGGTPHQSETMHLDADSEVSIYLYDENGVATIDIESFQVEVGIYATDNETYDGEVTNVAFPSGQGDIYLGRVNPVEGKLLVDAIIYERNSSTMNNNENKPGWSYTGLQTYNVEVGTFDTVVYWPDGTVRFTPVNVGSAYSIEYENDDYNVILPVDSYNMTQSQWISLGINIQILITLSTPIEVDIDPIEFRTFYKNNTYFTNSGKLDVEYRLDLAAYVDNQTDMSDKIEKTYPTDTASGAVATFTDGADDIPMKSVKVAIEPVQDLHGQDAPYPAGATANLFKATPYGGGYNETAGNDLKTAGAMAYNISSDGKIVFDATISWSGRLFATDALTAGDYVCRTYMGSENGRFTVYITDANLVVKSVVYNQSAFVGWSAVRTVSVSDGDRIAVFIGSNTVGKLISEFQVNSGTTIATIVPFENICPIPGWTGAQVVRTGKNLFSYDPAKATTGTTTEGTIRAYYPLEVSNCTLSFSAELIDSESITASYINIGMLKDGILSVLEGFIYPSGITEKTYMFSENEQAVLMTASTSVSAITTNLPKYHICVTAGLTPQSYSPYQGNTYSITFPSEAGTVYGGELDVTNGVLTVDRAIVDLGTLSFTKNDSSLIGVPCFYTVLPNVKNGAPYSNCSLYAIKSERALINANGQIAPGNPTNANYCVIRDDAYANSDATAFKTAMNGVQLVYELATPTIYHLTPTEIKSLLGDNNVWADAGDISVTYRADPNLYIDKRIGTEAPMIATDNIVSGSYFMVGSNLYKATANIANGAAVVVGTNAVAITMAEALNEINA